MEDFGRHGVSFGFFGGFLSWLWFFLKGSFVVLVGKGCFRGALVSLVNFEG